MKFLEVDLEEIIFNSETVKLRERGLNLYGHKFRQLRIGNYGVADIVTIQRPRYDHGGDSKQCIEKGEITVYELKKDKVSVSAFFQAVRYVRGIQRYIDERLDNSHEFTYRIILIGRELDHNSDVCYLPNLFTQNGMEHNSIETCSVELQTYHYDVDGIVFKYHCDYGLTNEGFKL